MTTRISKSDFIKAVASGLRNMNHTPDYLLIITERFNDWEWDEDTLCGIRVIKSYVSVNSGRGGHDYPVIPCFVDVPEQDIFMLVNDFQQGFEDSAGLF